MDGRLNAARRTPTLTKIDFAVLPETSCQGLFNQIHRKATKKVPGSTFMLLTLRQAGHLRPLNSSSQRYAYSGNWSIYISIWSSYRPVHSRIRQFARYGEHSNHGYFVDPWHIGNTVCLQTAFGRRWRRLRLLSAVVVGLRTLALLPMHAHRGQAFQGVTPSFHLSNYQLSKQRYFVVCPLTFYRQRTSRTFPEGVAAF